jgi:hypothetical protein
MAVFAEEKLDEKYILEKISAGETYDEKVIFDSHESGKNDERYILIQYGGYFTGQCATSGPCGCAGISSLSWLKIDNRFNVLKSDTKQLTNDCEETDALMVKKRNDRIELFVEAEKLDEPKYIFLKAMPEAGFKE